MNAARNAVRAKALPTTTLEYEDGKPRALADPGPVAGRSLAERSDDWQRVGSAIGRLSAKLRDAFVLRYVEELSYDEIATALAQPVGTVKANAHRGLIAVRAFLETNE